MGGVRVAYTLEQCWHACPAAPRSPRSRMAERAGRTARGGPRRRRRAAPPPAARAWRRRSRCARCRCPRRRSTRRGAGSAGHRSSGRPGRSTSIHATTIVVPPRNASPLVVTVHDLAFLHDPGSLHPPRRPRLHRGARPHPRARRPGAVLVASDAGRRRRRRARPREAPARPVGPRPGRATAGRGRGRRAAPARPRRSPVPALRRHPRAPQEPGPPAGGLPLARPRAADGRGRAGGLGRRGSPARASDGWGSSTRRRRRALYAGADAVCYPSLREGFGLPVLEAMAHGTPVVTSRGTATAEVGGDAVVLVDPLDVDRHRGAASARPSSATPSWPRPARCGRPGTRGPPPPRPSLAAYREAGAVTMPIGVNLLWCVPGQVGGSEEYLAARAGRPPDGRRPTSTADAVRPRRLRRRPPGPGRPLRAGRRRRSTVARRSLRVVAERTWLAAEAARRRLAARPPRRGHRAAAARVPRRVVLTHARHPVHRLSRSTSPAEAGVAAAGGAAVGLRAAGVVTAPSEFVRGTLVAELGVAPDRVQVVPHGLAGRLRQRPRRRGRAPRPLPPPRAVPPLPGGHVPPQEPPPRCCDVAGPAAGPPRAPARADRRLRAAARRTSCGRSTEPRAAGPGRCAPGGCPTRDRDGLLRCADALVFPSRYEGFGAPVLEAMAVGTPGDRGGRDGAAGGARPAAAGAGRAPPRSRRRRRLGRRGRPRARRRGPPRRA